MKKLLALILAVLMTAAMLAGCASDEAETPDTSDQPQTAAPEGGDDSTGEESTARDDITIWGNMMIDNYDPVDWSYAAQNNLFESVYSTLLKVSYNDDGTVEAVPDLAESW